MCYNIKKRLLERSGIMGLPVSNEYLTYADYLEWDETVRAEIIDGKLYDMSPSPQPAHQFISWELEKQIGRFLEDKPCRMAHAPFDVCPLASNNNANSDIDTVVQPDIFVICEKDKIDNRGYKGAPKFIIEILSPWNKRHDIIVKHDLYQRAGVREYWIVDPDTETVTAFRLDENGFLKPDEYYSANDTAKIKVLDDCPIDLKAVFKAKEF